MYIWLFIFLATLTSVNYLGKRNIARIKLEKITKNQQIKSLILNGNTSFLSYIINEVYFSEYISKSSLFDANKVLLDASPSFLINNLPGINKTSKKNIITINGLKYHYLYLLKGVNDKGKEIAYFKIQILSRNLKDLNYFIKGFSLSGLLFIFFTFFFILFDPNYIKENLVNRNNNFLILLLFLMFITIIIYLILNNSYTISRKFNSSLDLQNSAIELLTNTKKETDNLRSKLENRIKDHLSGSEYVINNIHIKFIKELKIEKDNIPIMFNGAIYFAIKYKSGALLFPLKDLYMQLNSMKGMDITVILKDQILFNSNIRGVILNELDYNLGRIKYTRNFINFALSVNGVSNHFIFIFSHQLKYFPFDIFFYLGVYFYLFIFLYFIIRFIVIYINRELLTLENGFLQLRSGNFDYRIETNGNTAFQKLYEDFNLMVKRLNIARKKELENEALKNLERISKKIAHEIKNPLTPITMLLSHLKGLFEEDKKAFNEEFLSSIDIIYEQLDYLKKISTEFYTLGKYSSFKREYFKLEDFMNEINNIYNDILKRSDITFHTKFPSIIVYTDKNILRHIFINIIENTIDILREKDEKWIKLNIQKDSNSTQITFEDSGGGINDELLSKIFDADFSTKKAGMGIGLSFVKKSIEIQKGTINAKNGEKGLIIEIYLPDL
ncbi:HAMP domain-containing histidine kinase [bacterium]|nr:HAMP domain-containing histidine kinase [bacterium]